VSSETSLRIKYDPMPVTLPHPAMANPFFEFTDADYRET
jgi:hypothetical protein